MSRSKHSVSEAELVSKVLTNACIAAGSQRAWARENDISEGYVSDVLQGRTSPSERMANALGYRRVKTYEKIK